MDLIITGDLRDEDCRQVGAELWRVPFRGWGDDAPNAGRAVVPAAPLRRDRRRIVRATRYTDDRTILPSEVFTLRVEAPSA